MIGEPFKPERVDDQPPTPLTPRKPKDYHGFQQDNLKLKTVDVNKEVSSSKQLKDKKINNMNAFSQTNIEKGIMDSAPEAPVSILIILNVRLYKDVLYIKYWFLVKKKWCL